MSIYLNEHGYKIVSTHVSSPDDDAPPAQVAFVICPLRGLLRIYVDDEEAAAAHAKREGAIIVDWTADADYRGEVTA